jgi:hypothetical protein
MFTDVSEQNTASIFYPEDGGSKRKIRATHWDVKEQEFDGVRFWAKGSEILMQKSSRIQESRKTGRK